MNNIQNKIIQKLKKEQIKPKPKYTFLLKKYLLWTSAIVAIILGSLALSIIYYFLKNQDISLYINELSLSQTLLISIPYLWIIALIGFLFLAAYNLKHIEFGYRLHIIQVIIVYFIISLILSIFIYQIGLADKLQAIFIDNSNTYQNYTHKKFEMWQRPDSGRLAGKLLINQNKILYLKDFKANLWLLDMHDLKQKPNFKLQPFDNIKVIGEKTGTSTFKVYDIKPLFRKPELHPHEPFCPMCE
jgi:hypothetical protein